jgi:hypothetical protein
MRRQLVYGHRLQHDQASRDFERLPGTPTLLKIIIEVCSRECDDYRGVRMIVTKTVDRRVAAPRVERDQQVVSTAFVDL